MQCRAPISITVGLIHFFLGAMGQERHHEAQVILYHSPQQLLAQRDVRLGQRSQEELLLVLGPDPALLLLPARWDTVTGGSTCLGSTCKGTGTPAPRVSGERLSHTGMPRIAPLQAPPLLCPPCTWLSLGLCHTALDR